MTQTLRDFISAREAEIKSQIKALHAELRELNAAKSAISATTSVAAKKPEHNRKTHREMIMAVLEGQPQGCTSDQVIDLIKEHFSIDIPQSSMSSQLSRAKSDGLLVLDQSTKVWRLAEQAAKENEPPLGGSDIGEAATSPKSSGGYEFGEPPEPFS